MGSLCPTFVSARLVGLAVKLAYANTLLKVISIHLERTFVRLRYSLGGDRPSQTAHLAMSLVFYEGRIEFSKERYFKVDSTSASADASKSPAYPTH